MTGRTMLPYWWSSSAATLPAGPRVPAALGIAIKVEDGDPASRIRAAVIVEVLRQLGVVTREDRDLWNELEEIAQPTERNVRGLEVGAYVAVLASRVLK